MPNTVDAEKCFSNLNHRKSNVVNVKLFSNNFFLLAEISNLTDQELIMRSNPIDYLITALIS